MPQTTTMLKDVSITPNQKIKRGAKVPFQLRLALSNTDGIPLELEISNTAQKHLAVTALPDGFQPVPGFSNKWIGTVQAAAGSDNVIIEGFTFHNVNTQLNGGVALVKVKIVNKKYEISRLASQSFE